MTPQPSLDIEDFLTRCRRVVSADDPVDAIAQARNLSEDSARRLGDDTGFRPQGLLRFLRRTRPNAVATEQVPTDVGDLLLPADDQVVLPWMKRYGSWEVIESEVLRSILSPGVWVLDIGAHVGYHTALSGQQVGPSGRVICFEPNRVNFSLLCSNAETTARGVARPLPAAVGNKTQVASFGISGTNSGDHSLDVGQGRETAQVVSVRIDDLVDPAWPIAVVKTDIQGADHWAIDGMRQMIDRHRPTLLAEYWPAGVEALGDDPVSALSSYFLPDYSIELVTANGVEPAPSEPEQVVARARRNEGAFLSLLLRPSSTS